MKKLRMIIIVLFTCAFSIYAQEKQALESPLLWKISGNGLDSPSYLLGTYHTIHYSFIDRIYGLNEAINQVKQVIVEKTEKELDKNYGLPPSGRMPKDTTYADILSKEDLQVLDSVLMKYMKTKTDGMHLRPKYLSVVLAQYRYKSFLDKTLGETPNPFLIETPQGIDYGIMQIAKEKDYTTLGLEKWSERKTKNSAEYIPYMSLEDEVLLTLYQAHMPLDSIYSYALESKRKYIEQNLEATVNIINKEYKLADNNSIYKSDLDILNTKYNLPFTREEIFEDLGKNRNIKWMEKLPKMMGNQPSLIAVGAAHLTGQNGLINLLRVSGYTVEPIKN